MTTITTYSISEAGLAFLADELNQRHKKFSASPLDLTLKIDRGILAAWAADAEARMDAEEPPEVEIRSSDAVSGHTELVRLDAGEHFTAEQQELEE
jgi:hypothetical protein